MFGALLFLDASILFLVKNRGAELGHPSVKTRQDDSSSPNEGTPEQIDKFAYYAMWVASVTLSITIICMTSIALLNRNLDAPKTLVINSRLIRIAPRLPAIILILCLPLMPRMNGGNWCGVVVTVLYAVFMWEWVAGLEKDWQLFERKEE